MDSLLCVQSHRQAGHGFTRTWCLAVLWVGHQVEEPGTLNNHLGVESKIGVENPPIMDGKDFMETPIFNGMIWGYQTHYFRKHPIFCFFFKWDVCLVKRPFFVYKNWNDPMETTIYINVCFRFPAHLGLEDSKNVCCKAPFLHCMQALNRRGTL